LRAVLLAAGLGTRMRRAFGDVPKILAPFGGRTLLDHQLDYLAGQGVDEVAINLHYHADQVLAHLGDRRLEVSVESSLLGTAGALLGFEDIADAPFFVLYGDVVTDLELSTLQLDGIATLACYPSSDLEGKGVLEVEPDGRVTAFLEKGSSGGERLVNAGIYLLAPEILAFVGDPPSDFGHDVFPRALAAGATITAVRTDAYVKDVGTPEALAEAERDLGL
jgi:mannose-1-phosphate guanylyltransferase